MKKTPIYICVCNKNDIKDLVVYMTHKTDIYPGKIVTKLLECILVNTDFLPFVVTTLGSIEGNNIIHFTDNEKSFFTYISSMLN